MLQTRDKDEALYFTINMVLISVFLRADEWNI